MKFLILLTSILFQANALAATYAYKIVLIDDRWPNKPFILTVDKSNTRGINDLESMFATAEQNGLPKSYIGVPLARVIKGPATFPEHAWSFHMDSKKVVFGDMTVEVCDAAPQYVEDDVDGWINNPGDWCPWAASDWVKEIWKGDTRLFP